MITVGFFGTPSLAAAVLDSLITDVDIDVQFVVSQPDRPIGRHQTVEPTPVKKLALRHNIPVFQPEKIKNNTEFLATLAAHPVDYYIVVAYGRILPKTILDAPRKSCINVHGSILPKYRGASPIQSSLIAGDSVTGVTVMHMSEGMDEGDIIDILEIPVDPFETSGSLFEKFAEVSGHFLVSTIKKLDAGELKPYPQNHAEATHCAKIEKDQGRLDFNKNAKELFHLWQGLTPWPGVYFMYQDKKIIVETCDFLPEILEEEIGTVYRLRGKIGIQCAAGVLLLGDIKPEGKKSHPALDFVNGHPGFVGSLLR